MRAIVSNENNRRLQFHPEENVTGKSLEVPSEQEMYGMSTVSKRPRNDVIEISDDNPDVPEIRDTPVSCIY